MYQEPYVPMAVCTERADDRLCDSALAVSLSPSNLSFITKLGGNDRHHSLLGVDSGDSWLSISTLLEDDT
jgi:hypothetical protein